MEQLFLTKLTLRFNFGIADGREVLIADVVAPGRI